MRVLLVLVFYLLLISGAVGGVAYMGGDLYPDPISWDTSSS